MKKLCNRSEVETAFLGVFTIWKMRLSASSYLPVCPQGTNPLLRRIFVKCYIRSRLEILWIKLKFNLNMTRITSTFLEYLRACMIIPRWILLKVKNVSHKILENMKARILYSVTFSWTSSHLGDNMEKHCMARQAFIQTRKNSVCMRDTKARIQKLSHNV